MWDWFSHVLHESAALRLFIVVAIGYLLGELRFPGNFRLGLAAVLFAGLGFGALDPKFVLPGEIQSIGLVLFVYCVGLEAAPGFVQSMRRDGLRLNLSAAASLMAAAGATWLAIKLSGRSAETLVGLFCGSLTNTPALGAASEWIARNIGSSAAANAAVVGYGVVYPFAVLTVLLLFQLRLMRAKPEELNLPTTTTLPRPQSISVETTNEGNPWVAEDVEHRTGVVLTRHRPPGGKIALVKNYTVLPPGTQVIAVGAPGNLQQGVALLGQVSPESLESDLSGFEAERYFVSNPDLVGRPIGSLGLEKLGAVVSRLRRGDVDLPVTDESVLQLGDRVRVVSYKENAPAIRKFFGNSLTAISETGYFSFGLGIAMGLLLGEIPIPVPGLDTPLRLGLAGGPLLMALILGYLGRTGPFIWNPPLPVNLTLRQSGILFFLACAGVKAGSVLPATLREQGVFLIAVGVGVTLLAHVVFWLLMAWPRKGGLDTLLGASAGVQTQPAALLFVAPKFASGGANIGYAAVYPLSMVLKVLLAQLLLMSK